MNNPIASSMFTPGMADVMTELGSANSMLASWVVSVYVLDYMVVPFLIPPLMELYGRDTLYHACNILSLIFTIACAVAQSLPQLVVFRLLPGIAGVCPLIIESGTAADLTGVMIMGTMLSYRESYAPLLLRRKAAHLCKETGNADLRSPYDWGRLPRELFMSAPARPMKLLFGLTIVFLLALFAAVSYGYLYLMFTTITSIFKSNYGFSAGLSGLSYLGFGVGSLLSLAVVGKVTNQMQSPIRLEAVARSTLVCRPWSTAVGASRSACSGVFGMGLITIFMSANTYLIDSYLLHVASVTAASAAMRSLVGAVLPLAGLSMYRALGLGWGNSLLAFIALAMCVGPMLLTRYGTAIRIHP
ncbi:MFS general substrate transporter [Penicillium riverlandense]|uniref:MFS general substrate transporter n=1 Tax=Penicillium riverlandense TaxID=1903569 RepID=UPI00254878D0|nr:MFS general substrate transporter [Penicillium riverlandense]KAJ5818989.1 MFS general substrate transporter [Penicillium riverlandense]